jgi:2',3'-cyclic-nucleotide 2'-phosphodiesterase (5'-nucleotidase family)
LVKAESQSLRAKGADLIVYSIHDGYTQSKSGVSSISSRELAAYYDASLSQGYVDLVFEGHTHRSYAMMDEYGVFHLQNGGDNDGIAHAELQINFANDNNKIRKAEIVPSAAYGTYEKDPLIDSLLAKYEGELAGLTRELGENGQRRSKNELRQLIADLYLDAAIEKWGSRYNIVLGGGYLSVRDPGYLAAGRVTYDTLCMLFPFDNELVLCSISGRYLKSQFLETSNSNYFISLSEYGQTVKESIDPNATYYVLVDRYSSTYAPNHLTEIELYDSITFARDLLATYIEKGGLR